MKIVLITGINGFTGKHFQKYLSQNNLDEKYVFYGIDKEDDRCENFIKYISVDLTAKTELKKLITRCNPDYIINFAGIFSTFNADKLIDTNANLTKNIFDAVLDAGIHCKKILIIGSAAEYGIPISLPVKETAPINPVSAYGVSKAIQTIYGLYYFNVHHIPCVIARPFNIIGQGISTSLSVGSFMRQIKDAGHEDIIRVGNVHTRRDFLPIGPVVDAYWKLLIKGVPGEIYNICSGRSISIKAVLNHLIKESGKNLTIDIDKRLLKINDIDDIFGDNQKIKRLIGWSNSQPDYFQKSFVSV